MHSRTFSILLRFFLLGFLLFGCSYESGPYASRIKLSFQVKNGSVTQETATSITFDVSCNGESAISQTIVLASSSSIIIRKNVVCTLDMTSYTRSGVAYTPAATHLIITISTAGAISSNATSTANAKRYTNGSANLYFVGGQNASATPYSIVLTFSSNLSSLLPLLPNNFTSYYVPNPTVSSIVYSYTNPSPNATTSLALSVSNANADSGYPTCVIVTEAASSAPTDQISAATQYNTAVTAILLGTTSSGSYGNSCATSNSIYCRCPSAFNSTLVSGAGNWDIFYTTNQVIIWINYDDNSPYGSAYTVLNVPAAP